MKKVNSKQLLIISMLTIGSLSQVANCATATKPATPGTNVQSNSKSNSDVANWANSTQKLYSTLQPTRQQVNAKKNNAAAKLQPIYTELNQIATEISDLYGEVNKLNDKIHDAYMKKNINNKKLQPIYEEIYACDREINELDRKAVPLYAKVVTDAAIVAKS